jgi:hypothetical protein
MAVIDYQALEWCFCICCKGDFEVLTLLSGYQESYQWTFLVFLDVKRSDIVPKVMLVYLLQFFISPTSALVAFYGNF